MANTPWDEHTSVLNLRRRSAAVDLSVRTAQNFRSHRTGRNATLVAHYAFVSVFPLLLVLTTVLGFVLDSHEELRTSIIDSAFNRIPFVGHQLKSDPSQITGSAIVLIVGLAVALWAGLRAFNVLQAALDDIAEVPSDQRPTLLHTRARSLLGIAIVGGAQVGTSVLAALISVAGVSIHSRILFAVAAVVVNAAVLAASYRWMCMRDQSWHHVAPGAIAGGVALAVLQFAGTAVVGRAIANAGPVYGDFATVIGLLTWFSLHSAIALLGAELNQALPARRFAGEPSDGRADQLADDRSDGPQASTT